MKADEIDAQSTKLLQGIYELAQATSKTVISVNNYGIHQQGTDLKVQQSLLRHADIRTTMNIYTKAVPERLRQANSKVVSILLSGRKTA